MTTGYLQEIGVDNYLLEDSSGIYLVDERVVIKNETVGITETRQPHWTKVIINQINLSDATNKIRGLIKNFAETVGLTEAFNKLLAIEPPDILQVINENIDLTETSQKLKGFLTNISNTVGITYAQNYAKGFVKVITSSLVSLETALNSLLVEVFIYLLEDGSGRYQQEENTDTYLLEFNPTPIVKVIDTIMDITEAVTKNLGNVKNITSTVNLQELSNRLGTIIREFGFTVGITEANNRARIMFRNVTTATVGLVEASNRKLGLIRNIASTLGLTEANNRLLGLIKNFAETVGITEVFNTIAGIVKVIADTVGLTDLINKIRQTFISNNIGDFVALDSVNLGVFTALDSYDIENMTVIDSYNFDILGIIDDN